VLIGIGVFFWYQYPQSERLKIQDQITSIAQKGIEKSVNAPGALVAKVESNNAFLTVTGVLRGTNAERKKEEIYALTQNQQLNTIARIRMNDMFTRGYFEHISPQGQSASSVAGDVGYEYVSIGENIAMGNFADDDVLVKAWMDSPGHRANILRASYTQIGIAVGKGNYNGRTTWIGVQIFGKSLSECPPVNSNLKADIDAEISMIGVLKQALSQKEVAMNQLKESGDWNAFNAEVAKYNGAVKEINAMNAALQEKLSDYNSQIRLFNSCIK